MKNKCAKCKGDLAGGSIITEGGKSFLFCKTCVDFLQEHPSGHKIHHFLPAEKETWVAKNVREAKERREKGETPWSKPCI